MKIKLLLFAFAAPVCINAQVYLSENFNSGIPASWTVSTPVCWNSAGDTIVWTGTIDGWRGQGLSAFSLDSTEFVVVDSDLPGVFCQCSEFLTSPVFNPSAASTLFLDFDQYFRYYTGGFSEIGEVQVYDGTSWVVIYSFTATSGAWMAPSHQSINLLSYINAAMQIRFWYNANWDWFWALDNITVAENPLLQTQVINGNNTLTLYPNPSTGIFYLLLANLNRESEKTEIEIYNPMGEIIFASEVNGSTATVDLGKEPKGIYFVKVQVGKKFSLQKVAVE